MQDLAKGAMTMVVVTQEIDFARAVGNRIVFLENGEIIEEGLSNECLDNPKTERPRRFLSEISPEVYREAARGSPSPSFDSPVSDARAKWMACALVSFLVSSIIEVTGLAA
ncbi:MULTISPECIES: amino acid ABC transporter ATP-binding protein [Rhizobium/Agrobacterium group]|nr:amino acid ABC transporter ATP-binding protein [Rhizobium sp. 16-488-2b]MBO9176845.1 amino acid ABC transporter ATP-binding protein [Rhizobium sp. 16-488-2a]MBO9197414.1 amino acid ABC transporter ATP-binding protein [Rhizobium sp. 16-449-1b]